MEIAPGRGGRRAPAAADMSALCVAAAMTYRRRGSNEIENAPGGQGDARWIVAILFAVGLFNWMDRMILSVLVEPVRHDLRLSDLEIGLLTGPAFALTYAVAGLLFGYWADHSDRRKLLAVVVAIWSVGTMMCGVGATFVQLFMLRLLVGTGEAGSFPITLSILPERLPTTQRNFALSLVLAGSPLGVLIGSVLAGLIEARWGWRAAFVMLGIPGLLLALLIVLKFDDRRPAATGTFEAPLRGLMMALLAVFRVPTSRYMMIAYAIMSMFAAGLLYWTPAFFIRHHGMSVKEAGSWFGLATGGGALVGYLASGLVADRLVKRSVRWMALLPAIAAACATLAYLAAYASSQTALAIACFAIGSVIVAASGAPSLSTIQSVLPPRVRGTCGAVIGLISSLFGMGLASVLVGALSEAFAHLLGASGLRAALLVTTLFGFPAAAMMWLSSRTLTEDLERVGRGSETTAQTQASLEPARTS